MTTELVLLLAIFVFITAGAFFGPKGPFEVFKNSGPRLGARLERQIATGGNFVKEGSTSNGKWVKPEAGPAPTGQF